MQTRFLVVEVCFSGSTVCTNFVCIGIQVFLRSTTCSTILWLWWTTEELCGHRVQLWEVVNLPESEICCSCNIIFFRRHPPTSQIFFQSHHVGSAGQVSVAQDVSQNWFSSEK